MTSGTCSSWWSSSNMGYGPSQIVCRLVWPVKGEGKRYLAAAIRTVQYLGLNHCPALPRTSAHLQADRIHEQDPSQRTCNSARIGRDRVKRGCPEDLILNNERVPTNLVVHVPTQLNLIKTKPRDKRNKCYVARFGQK